MSRFYDDLETRSAEVRDASFKECLPIQIKHAKTHAPISQRPWPMWTRVP